MPIINSRIKQVREFLKLKQIPFSKEIGITQGFLSDIEREESKPSVETLVGIVKKFKEIDERWLLTGEGDIKKKVGISLDELPRQYCTFVKSLAEIPRDVKTEEYISIPLVEGSVAAGLPIINDDKIEGFAIIHVSQVGRRQNLVAVRVDKNTGRSMEPLIRPGSMVAIDRDDREIIKKKIYAVRKDSGITLKFIQREGDTLLLIPANREVADVQVLDLRTQTQDPIVGRVIWNWQTL